MAAKNPEVSSPDPAYAARKKNLDLALQQIAKDYGEGAIMRLGDDHILPVEVIPTGNILIDRALGRRRIPAGTSHRNFRTGILRQNDLDLDGHCPGAKARRPGRVH